MGEELAILVMAVNSVWEGYSTILSVCVLVLTSRSGCEDCVRLTWYGLLWEPCDEK